MKHVTIITVFLIGFAISALAGNNEKTLKIQGVVYENSNGTKAPLTLAYVYVDNSVFCTYTDKEGNFKLEVPSGEYKIKVSYLGYESETKSVNTNKMKEVKLNFVLTSKEENLTRR